MVKYIIKRVLLLIPAVLLVCITVFLLMRLIPGSAVDAIVYKYSSIGVEVDEDAVRAQLGLDKPAAIQFFVWFKDVIQGNLGDSLFQNKSVHSILAAELPVTFELGIITIILSTVISIPLGLLCAARQDSGLDIILRVIAIIFLSIPVFWIATMVLVYPAAWWGYAPPADYVGFLENPWKNLQMFLIPALLSALGQVGMQMRLVRTQTLEVMRQDYVRTAWSKGLNERTVLFGYAFRNSMIPTITMIGGSVSSLIGGSVIMENLFNIPGIGKEVVAALSSRDYPLVQGCVIIFAIYVMVINLVVDICYKWADPRVSLE